MSFAPGAALRTRSPRSLDRLGVEAENDRVWLQAPCACSTSASGRSSSPTTSSPPSSSTRVIPSRATGSRLPRRGRTIKAHRDTPELSCFRLRSRPEDAGYGLGQSLCPVGRAAASSLAAARGGLGFASEISTPCPGSIELGLRLLAARPAGRAAVRRRGQTRSKRKRPSSSVTASRPRLDHVHPDVADGLAVAVDDVAAAAVQLEHRRLARVAVEEPRRHRAHLGPRSIETSPARTRA